QGGGSDRGVGQDAVGAGAVLGGHVAFVGGPGDDLQLGAQPAAVESQVDVEVIVVGGQQGGGGLIESGRAQDLEIGGVAFDHVEVRGHPSRDVLDNGVGNSGLVELLRGRSPHPAATQDQHGALRFQRITELGVVGVQVLLGRSD